MPRRVLAAFGIARVMGRGRVVVAVARPNIKLRQRRKLRQSIRKKR